MEVTTTYVKNMSPDFLFVRLKQLDRYWDFVNLENITVEDINCRVNLEVYQDPSTSSSSVYFVVIVDPPSGSYVIEIVRNSDMETLASYEVTFPISAEGSALTPEQSTMMLEMYRLMGLDPTRPLLVTQTERMAGPEIIQTIEIDQNAKTTLVSRE